MNQFDVYLVNLNPTQGSEMNKIRPCVIISPDAMNNNLNTVLIAPLTHTIKGYPSRVPSNFNNQKGEIVLDQIRAIDKSRLQKKQGTISSTTGSNIKKVLATMFQ